MSKTFFNQTAKNDWRTYGNTKKNETFQGDDYTTSFLWDYNYFNKYYTMMTIDLSKQQELDADPKAIQQINFTGNLARQRNANTTLLFIIEEAKETILGFPKGTVKVL